METANDTVAEPETSEPTLEEVKEALRAHVQRNGALRSGVAATIAREHGWHGRVMDVLAVLTADTERMGYLTGGHRPDEVMTWLPAWVDSPFSPAEISAIVESAGWDPEPFVVVQRAGLLERLLRRPDGSLRRVRGERAGGWLSDSYALADEAEILRAVLAVVEEDEPGG